MARKRRQGSSRRRTFFKEWREFRHLSQAQASERIGVTQASLSRVETGVHAYTQDMLEKMAYAYMCEPGDLIMRNPLDEDAAWSIADNLRQASPEQRSQATAVLAALLKRAG